MSDDLLYGFNTVVEVLKKIKTGTLYIQEGKKSNSILNIIKKVKESNIDICFKDKGFFNSIFKGRNHQGIALETEEQYLSLLNEKELLHIIKLSKKNSIVILILDGITDVGNFGAILRTSALFNVDFVILPKNNSVPVNNVVISHSMGGIFHLSLSYVNNLHRLIETLKKIDFWIYALDKKGTDITKINFNNKIALVFGSEDRGIRNLVKRNCDEIITIPTNKKLDSLNVSVSVGITLFEVYNKHIGQ